MNIAFDFLIILTVTRNELHYHYFIGLKLNNLSKLNIIVVTSYSIKK